MGLAFLAAGLATSVVACGGSSRVNISRSERTPRSCWQCVRNVVQVSQLTGPSSPSKTDRFHVAGQDLGSMFEAGGKTWFEQRLLVPS
jgi:hypothetical protein